MMLSFVSKEEYWAAEDAGMLSRTTFDPSHFQIKNIQDAIVMYRLDGLSGKAILEVGGGHSRVLDYLSATNRCVNIDPLEGFHGGPVGGRGDKVQKYEQVYGEIGKSSGVLADKSFDVVFSISVVEHVPLQDIDEFWRDTARILRPGGRMLHLIDCYLGVEADVNSEPLARYLSYRRAFESALFRPMDPMKVITEESINFHPMMASNPDNIMNEWNRMAPNLRDLRKRAQAVTFVMDAIRN